MGGMLIGEPQATPEELLPAEIRWWTKTWRDQGLSRARAVEAARVARAKIARQRGQEAAAAWWRELQRQEPGAFA